MVGQEPAPKYKQLQRGDTQQQSKIHMGLMLVHVISSPIKSDISISAVELDGGANGATGGGLTQTE